MISKTKIRRRIYTKSNPYLVETLKTSMENSAWTSITQIISSSTRKRVAINLDRIEKESSEGDTIVVPGKVLSKGEISKKLNVCALAFSEAARKKIEKAKGKAIFISEEISKNPKMEGIKVIK